MRTEDFRVKILEIVLKSGAVVRSDATACEVKHTVLGQLTSVSWTKPDNPDREMLFLDLSEVASVVVLN